MLKLNPLKQFLFIILILTLKSAFAGTSEPLVVNATVTATQIEFTPNVIPENVPFVIHIINKAGAPIELENSDTSVEVYPNVDKTFKVGLTAGKYMFFNDFNAHTQSAILTVQARGYTQSGVVPVSIVEQQKTANLNVSGILFIVWRESVEALLVVGIVYSWLNLTPKPQRRSGLICLWLGMLIGLFCAIVLSYLLITLNHILAPDTANIFQAGMTFVAAVMIVYMVKWMRINGRKLKADMQQSLEKSSSIFWRNISILTVVAVAVAREASEASIFIYALGFGNQSHFSFQMLGILGLGILLAVATIALLQWGNKIISWRFFFKVTEILLLLLGGGLLLNGIDRLIVSGILNPLHSKIWDTSFLISDGGFLAPLLSSFLGYRAMPSLMCVISYIIYWIVIYWVLKNKKRVLPHAT